MKKLLAIILLFVITFLPVCAKNLIDTTGIIKQDFSMLAPLPKIINFTPYEDIIINDKTTIPKGSQVSAEILKHQKELRWHKSAFLVVKVLSYKLEKQKKPTKIKDEDVILVVRKYKRYDGRAASIIATEIIASNAADFFAQGLALHTFS